ncbi:unnamed protein product [Plutella xylostella]|uniref:(diamondback moth) hypothetical protein n=1 Tax=Plutella xylostella TaxID=51655 RepID=A0A8S4DZ65_PLUXY|nr:unnamed protein product [Plutella xylostella]
MWMNCRLQKNWVELKYVQSAPDRPLSMDFALWIYGKFVLKGIQLPPLY